MGVHRTFRAGESTEVVTILAKTIVTTITTNCLFFRGPRGCPLPYLFRVVAKLCYPKYNTKQTDCSVLRKEFCVTFQCGPVCIALLPFLKVCVMTQLVS